MEVKSKVSSKQQSRMVTLKTPTNAESRKLDDSAAKTMQMSQSTTFDPFTHKPPRIDQFGYNKETHKGRELLNRNAKNILTEPNNQIPLWWTSKNIRDSKFLSGSLMNSPKAPEIGPLESTKSVEHKKSLSVMPEK